MELKERYKGTEVGSIPEDWVILNIAKSSTLKARIGWQGLTTSEYLNSGDYFLITGTDFIEGKIRWETCHYVNKERFIQDKNIQAKIGDILITKDGTIGKVAYLDKLPLDATLNSGVFVIRPKENAYYPLYCYYIFNSKYFVDFLRKLVAGSTINHLYQKDFVLFNFPLPKNLAEQSLIATALSDIDKLINHLEKLIEKKRNIKQGVMQELFRPKSGWIKKELKDIFQFRQGIQCSIEHQESDFREGLIRFIRIIDLTQKMEPPRYINDPGEAYHVDTNDLFMVRYGNPGLLGHGFKGVIANNLFRLIPKIKLENKYFYYLLSFKNDDILQLVSSTTMAALNFTSLNALSLFYPVSLDEQKNTILILSDMDNEIALLEKKLTKTKLIRQGMMQNLLTGKIRLV